MTWLTGSCTEEPGSSSSRLGSEFEAAAGVAENETKPVSRECLLRVGGFTAVMIWRVMHSSAKLRNEDSRSGRKSRIALYRPTSPSWIRSSPSPPMRKYEDAFKRTNDA